MQSAIGAEYKAKYESVISAQKDKIKLLQSKNAQMQKKHEAELKDAERKGASVAMTKMAKAMKHVRIDPQVALAGRVIQVVSCCTGQAKTQQEKEAAKAQQKAEMKHQKELRRAKALALAQANAATKVKKEVVQEGKLPLVR